MQSKKGWAQQCMMSLFKKEATYDAGVTMSNANSCSMQSFELTPDWDDTIRNDKDQVTNKEHGNTQEIQRQGIKLLYKELTAKPNTLAGLGMLAFGAETITQDEALASYKHKITPVAHGTALPSMQVEHLKGGIQYAYKGVKCNTLKIAGEQGGYANVEAELIGSGTRATSATAFSTAISESWLKLANCKVWMETGANISIDATLTQATENISSATPDTLHTRIKSFEWMWNNNLVPQEGFGGAGVYQDCDFGRRMQELSFTLLFNDSTELDYFLNLNPCAIEFDLKGGIIAAGTGTDYYYGFHLIIPRFFIKKAPLPIGGVDDTLECEFECECVEDGTNAPVILEAYTAQASYLGA